MKTESESIEAIILRDGSCSRDLWRAWRIRNCRKRDVRRSRGGRGLWGGQEGESMRCLLDDLRALVINNADQ